MTDAADVSRDQVANLLYPGYIRPYATNTIEVSFLTALPVYGTNEIALSNTFASAAQGGPKFKAFDVVQQDRIREVFAAISKVANVNFVFTTTPTAGAIRLGIADLRKPDGSKMGGVNGKGFLDRQTPSLNDIYIDVATPALGTMPFGGYAVYALLHEVGHALGLEHPDPTDAPTSTTVQLSRAVSVMSYADYINSDGSKVQGGTYGISPLVLDILALQTLWGKRDNILTGDTTYLFDPNIGKAATDNSDTTIYKTQIKAIWDTGGKDTLDASLYTERVAIDLRPGYLSSIGNTKNIGIAFDADIENARGGEGNDEIIGNDLDNKLEGGKGNDILEGRKGQDKLYGEAGNDLLIGGKDNDTLEGGADFDTYIQTTSDGVDTITDSDGKGRVILNNTADGNANSALALFIGVSGQPGTWQSPDGALTLTQGSTWTLSYSGGSIDLGSNFASGQLGIRLIDAMMDPVTISPPIKGDFKPIDTDPVQSGDQFQNDALGNIITGTEAEPDRKDTLYDSTGNDHIISGGGNDTVYTTRGGDNKVETGAGRDWVYGGAGKDLVIGGVDADILQGGAGHDRLYADAQITLAEAISNGNSQTGSGQKGDWLAGNAGDDILVGAAGDDVLTGGGGADLLIGGAGVDRIAGDVDWVPLSLDWTVINNFFQPVTGANHPTDFGADEIYAGAGNDWAWGGRGDDTLYGEGGDDYVYGNGDNDALFGGAGKDQLYGDGIEVVGDIETDMGDDYLDGGADDDKLYGGEGNDILIGGTGVDILEGGAGQDIYIFNKGDGGDTVIDTKADKNIFRFGEGITSKDITLRLGSLLLDLGNGDQIHIDNFNQSDALNSVAIDSFQFADGSTLSSNELLARGFDIDGTEQSETLIGTSVTDRMRGFGRNDLVIGLGGDGVWTRDLGMGNGRPDSSCTH